MSIYDELEEEPEERSKVIDWMNRFRDVLFEMKLALDENKPEKVLELYKEGHEILTEGRGENEKREIG